MGYSSLGNHDWEGHPSSEIEYKHNWVMKDYNYAHTHDMNGTTVGFVHFDTSYLAYGSNGENSAMKHNFDKMDWSDDKVLALMEKAATSFSATYKFAVGRHPIGYSCGGGELKKVNDDIVEKYHYSAYFCGHLHGLCYGNHDGRGYYLSGAGGYAGTVCHGTEW